MKLPLDVGNSSHPIHDIFSTVSNGSNRSTCFTNHNTLGFKLHADSQYGSQIALNVTQSMNHDSDCMAYILRALLIFQYFDEKSLQCDMSTEYPCMCMSHLPLTVSSAPQCLFFCQNVVICHLKQHLLWPIYGFILP